MTSNAALANESRDSERAVSELRNSNSTRNTNWMLPRASLSLSYRRDAVSPTDFTEFDISTARPTSSSRCLPSSIGSRQRRARATSVDDDDDCHVPRSARPQLSTRQCGSTIANGECQVGPLEDEKETPRRVNVPQPTNRIDESTATPFIVRRIGDNGEGRVCRKRRWKWSHWEDGRSIGRVGTRRATTR